MKTLLKSLTLSVLLLAGCGGGDAIAQTRVFVQPSDRIESAAGYDVQIQPTPINAPLPDVVSDVARQAALGPNVMLWIGGQTDEVVQRFPALIEEAKKHPNIRSVYLIDEMFLGPNGIEIGRYEREVLEGARIAHAAGLKTVITMLPEVILSPNFRMQDINAFDVIGVDVYPSIRVDNNTHGCRYSDNVIENLLRCSFDKLVALGYRGQKGYVSQAFELNTLPSSVSFAHAALQRPVIDSARWYGVDVLVPWGLYLGKAEIAAESYLTPLGGTPFEYLVRP